MIPNKLTMRI